MNFNKIIMVSLSLFFSQIVDASIPKTCLQKSYHELKKIALYSAIGTYIHQNIMTQQDITKMPNVTTQDILDYKNILGTTLHNGCQSFDNTYSEFKKLMTGMNSFPKDSFLQSLVKKESIKESVLDTHIIYNDEKNSQLHTQNSKSGDEPHNIDSTGQDSPNL